MKRFNSPEHLEIWKLRGRYPAIHDAIGDAAATYMRGSRLLDLGCSYGLLGARIGREAGMQTVIGIEADPKVIEASRDAGVGIKLFQMRVTAETLEELAAMVAGRHIDVIVARRIMPELFGDNLEFGKRFAAAMAAAGVKEMFVEGRVVSARSTNALASIDHEVAMLSGSFHEVRRIKAVSYLQAI